ncbi:MAG: hypothetical protein HY721_26875 [Planctomycetes bacterium]|nr:hypothetical protein [Planctomycetota bacterium]
MHSTVRGAPRGLALCPLAFCLLLFCGLAIAAASLPAQAYEPVTAVTLKDGTWRFNGKPTYPGSRAQGLLLNASMLNAVFEDGNPETCPKGFDPEVNTAAFVAKVPEYVACGVRAFTVGLQGASPGYAGAGCSAFERDGSLRGGYMARVARVIEACDRAGAAVILCLLHHEQDQVLADAAAVRKAVAAAAGWVAERGYRNVLLEVADEHPQKGYDHAAIREGNAMRQLIRLAKQAAPGLLVSASGGGGGRVDPAVLSEADFVLIHVTSVPVEEILERIVSADKVSKAIVCNADGRTGQEGAGALEATVNALASYGYLNVKVNQRHPFTFGGAADDPAFYAKLKELTGPAK